MEIISVVLIENDIVHNIKHFIIDTTDFSRKQKSISDAEEYFISKAKEIGCTDNEIETAVESGYFVSSGLNPKTVNLIWSSDIN